MKNYKQVTIPALLFLLFFIQMLTSSFIIKENKTALPNTEQFKCSIMHGGSIAPPIKEPL